MEAIFSLNQDLFFKIFNLSRQNQIVDSSMIFAANYLIFMVAILSLFLALRGSAQGKKALLLTLLSFVVGFVLLKIVGIFIYEPRPFLTHLITPLVSGLANDDSFPSDHTLVLSIMSFSHVFYKTEYAWVMILALVWTGFARIFVGAHYPLDILGGFVIGLLSVTISWWIKNWLVKRFFSLDLKNNL